MRTVWVVLLAVLGWLAVGHGAGRGAMAASLCEQYPIPLWPDGDALPAAQAELAQLSSGARLTWNTSTGTLTQALQLAIPLPGCVDGQDGGPQVLGVLAAHPTLFQLDLSEWKVPEPFDCRFVNDVLLGMGRRQLAGRSVAHDVFAFSLKRINGTVHLTGVAGTYLPIVAAATGEAMAACNTLALPAAMATVRSSALKATVFSRCARTGTLAYTPQENDTFRLFPEDRWTWQEDRGRVLLIGERTLRVTVNPANYTAALFSSDARCPALDGDPAKFVIGFDVVLDVHTGAIVSVKPGLDCTVC